MQKSLKYLHFNLSIDSHKYFTAFLKAGILTGQIKSDIVRSILFHIL